jgi:hypothetical protein
MGRRRANKKLSKHGGQKPDPADVIDQLPDALVRFLACHPTRDVLALAVGQVVRILHYG